MNQIDKGKELLTMVKEKVLIVLWTTSRCNLACKYCYAGSTHLKADMDFEIAAQTLDLFSDHTMKIQFAGGEPLLNYPLICQVVDYVNTKKYNASFRMQTNGTGITPEIAAGLKKMKIALGVSLDGPPEVNEFSRGKTREVIAGIGCLADEGIKINLNSVVTSHSVMQLPKLVNFAYYLGNVGGIGLDLLRDAGRARDNPESIKKATPEQLQKALKEMVEAARELYELTGKKIVIREIHEARQRLKTSPCSKAYCYASCGRSYVVLPDGDVYPCGSLIDQPEYYMGNVNEKKLKSIAIGKTEPETCKTCEFYAFCPGGCPSRLLINGNDGEDLSLDCVLKKTAFEMARKNS
ncbi:radical SAM protein [Acetobacterium wieringae]|uniref:radical SAM/SPASM domain-containing protein n=1 Tax=Acetobacterium wieringae TaxID=52694 RepID=UPI0026E95537|nr:radical SAM protein [Acetobacterium wieringae]